MANRQSLGINPLNRYCTWNGKSFSKRVEINACLHHVPDVGCDTFACLENTTCKLDDNSYEICRDFLQNAGNFDVQEKLFIKDFLKCSAIGIKSRFSSSVTRCAAVQRILVHVQAKCYQEHNICAAAKSNIDALVNMIDFNKTHLNGILRQLLQDYCTIMEKTTPSISEGHVLLDDNSTEGDN
ncbi:stanniocalcin-1-like isoform X1 [Pristis pectinata]|uniref:stanniocalcin-1-like isoform X1 n=1 Tax=Pristis pectinata TaxID=685728 RepID=UPI00223D1A3E|nr:stanniocalcin-1-like isoform X1 [Pristis pectinata]